MNPLTPEEFRDALRKGLGRAVRHLEQYGASGLIDDILFATLHNLAYDPQMNGNRYNWILRLIELTGIEDFFRERILEALLRSREKYDLSLLFALASEFAEDGDEDARAAIYEKFERQEMDEPWLGGTSLVCLDGMKGFLHVAEVIGARMRRDPGYRERLRESGENHYMVTIAADNHEKSEIHAALRERVASNTAIRTYLEESERYLIEERAPASATEPPSPISADDVLACIERLEWTKPYKAWPNCRRLTPDARQTVFEAMLAESRREQRLRYLWLFWRTPLPRFDEKLLEWAASGDLEISRETLGLLAKLVHPQIRNFAVKFLRKPGANLIPRIIRLFGKNYQAGDAELLRSALWIPDDPHTAHAFILDIINLSTEIRSPEMRELLLWAYEHSPCAECRGSAVRYLTELNLAPHEILWECLMDSNDDTRELARAALEDGESRL